MSSSRRDVERSLIIRHEIHRTHQSTGDDDDGCDDEVA